jgi:hypothetical protein
VEEVDKETGNEIATMSAKEGVDFGSKSDTGKNFPPTNLRASNKTAASALNQKRTKEQGFTAVGSEEARLRAGLRPPLNCTCGFPACSFCEDSASPG